MTSKEDKNFLGKNSVKLTDCWNTPTWLIEHFKNHFDPCPNNPNFDGLTINWINPTFVNPPYSKPLEWIKKAIKESKKGISVVMLLRVDPSTEWYKLLVENNAHFSYFNERLKFNDVKSSSNFSSMLVFLNGE